MATTTASKPAVTCVHKKAKVTIFENLQRISTGWINQCKGLTGIF